ncbi:MAG: hypothetical protein AB8U26_01010, partial [Rickettsiales endosymbiont of Dermacentor nuttalli]
QKSLDDQQQSSPSDSMTAVAEKMQRARFGKDIEERINELKTQPHSTQKSLDDQQQSSPSDSMTAAAEKMQVQPKDNSVEARIEALRNQEKLNQQSFSHSNTGTLNKPVHEIAADKGKEISTRYQGKTSEQVDKEIQDKRNVGEQTGKSTHNPDKATFAEKKAYFEAKDVQVLDRTLKNIKVNKVDSNKLMSTQKSSTKATTSVDHKDQVLSRTPEVDEVLKNQFKTAIQEASSDTWSQIKENIRNNEAKNSQKPEHEENKSSDQEKEPTSLVQERIKFYENLSKPITPNAKPPSGQGKGV